MLSRVPLLATLAATIALGAVPAPTSAQERTAASEAAEGTVRGRIVNAESGNPVRARVGIVAAGATGERAVSTDDEGRYVLRAVAAGEARLRVRALGYAARDTTIVVVPSGELVLELRLVPVPRLLGGIRTVASSPDRDRFEHSADVSAMTMSHSALSRAPALGESDVLRAVALLPGVAARSDDTAGFIVRGGEADQNLVLLDGTPVYNPFHFGGLFGTFIDEAVDRVDLTAGGFGPAFGGRLSSVLDVSSREEGRPGTHGAVEVSLLSSSATLGGSASGGRVSWNVAARRTYADRVIGVLTNEEFPYHFQDAQFHGAALLPGGGTLGLTAYAGRDELAPLSDVSSEDEVRFDWGNSLAGLSYSQPLGARTTLAQRAWISTFRTHFDADSGRTSLFDAIADLSLAGGITHALGAHTVGAGYELSSYAIRYRERVSGQFTFQDDFGGEISFDGDTARPPLHQRQTAGALYVEDAWRVTPRLLVRGGVRAERVAQASWTGVSPRVSLRYWLTKDLALSGAAGRYAQWLHAVRNEDLPLRVFDVWLTSDALVPVSRATHVVTGVERWLGDHNVARVEGYWKRFEDLPEPRSVVDPRIRKESMRLFDGTSYGADLFLRRLEGAGPFSGWLSYSYALSVRERAGVRYAPGQDRRHNANVVLSWSPSRARYSLGARYGIASGNPYTASGGERPGWSYDAATNTWRPAPETDSEVRGGRNASRYPLYQRADLSLERAFFPHWGTVRTTLAVVNVFNRRNVFLYDFDYAQTPPTARALSQFPLLPTVGMKVEF
jgi:hypothetical protein